MQKECFNGVLATFSYNQCSITVTDTRRDDQHLSVHIITEHFQEKSLIQRHRQVYDALQGQTGYKVHALSLCTQTPEEASG